MTDTQSIWRNRIVGHADVNPKDLLANPKNWRVHPEFQADALEGIIDDVGLVDTVKVQQHTNLVLDGHLRVALALKTNQPTIPVTFTNVTDEEADKVLVSFDSIGALANTAGDTLRSLLASVETPDARVNALLELMRKNLPVLKPDLLTDPDAAPPLPAEPVTRPGDLYALGDHRLLCGDATDAGNVRRLMTRHRSRLMPTDPPYLVDYQGGNHPQSWHNKVSVKDKHWDDYKEGESDDLFHRFIAVAKEHALTTNPAIYQFHAAARADLVMDAWKTNGLLCHQQIIWVKARPVLGRGHYMWQHEPCQYGWVEGKLPDLKPPANAKTVWDVNQQGETDGIHPTQKPTELIKRMIEYHTKPEDVVYEPFAGSGTCLISCEILGRRCFAMELSPAFCDVIVTRWQNATGRTAQLLGSE